MVSEVSSEVLKLSVQGPAWAGGADPSRALPANVGLFIPHLGAFMTAAMHGASCSCLRAPPEVCLVLPGRVGLEGGWTDRQEIKKRSLTSPKPKADA